MELEAKLSVVSRASSLTALSSPNCSSFGNDQDSALTTIVQPQPDVHVWPQDPAHESIAEPVLMLPVNDVARVVTPGDAGSTMSIDIFINAFKKLLGG